MQSYGYEDSTYNSQVVQCEIEVDAERESPISYGRSL